MPFIPDCTITIVAAKVACNLVFGQVDWTNDYTQVDFVLNPPAYKIILFGDQELSNMSEDKAKIAKKELRKIIGNKFVACVGNTWGKATNFGGECYVLIKDEYVNIREELHKRGF